MEHLDDWRLYNQKSKLSASDYVDGNLLRLLTLFGLENDFDEDEAKKILVDYFTKYPDQIKSISFTTVGRPNPAAIPRLNNIGGVVKYR